MLIGVNNILTTEFEIIKEMGNTNDKSEIIKINMWKNGNHITTYAVYSPPNNKPDFSVLNFTYKTVLIGDFNAHSVQWGYKDRNAAGKEIEDILNSTFMELIYKTGDPHTYLHYNGTLSSPDLLLVSSDISPCTERFILNDPGSGHRPVIANIQLFKQRKEPQIIRTSWNFKKANWKSFTELTDRELKEDNFDFSEHPGQLGIKISKAILKCAKLCIPRGAIKQYKSFWNKELEELKVRRDYLRVTAEMSGKQEDVQNWRKQAAIMKRAVLEAKRTAFTTFITHINYKQDSLKTYKYLAKLQNTRSSQKKEPICQGNGKLYTDKTIANAFVKTYAETQRKTAYARKNTSNVRKATSSIKKCQDTLYFQNNIYPPEGVFDAPITSHELLQAITQLKNKKSP